MLYWKVRAEGSTVVGNPHVGGGEEHPPAQDSQLLPPGAGTPCTRALRNAFTFSQYYSLKLKIKTYFVLGFVTILALLILNTSGNTGMDCWAPKPRFEFRLNSPEVSFFHLSRSLELCTHILLSWSCPGSPRGWGSSLGHCPPLQASHPAFVQRKLPEP